MSSAEGKHGRVDAAAIAAMFEERSRMLASLKGDIPIARIDELSEKLKQEEAMLHALAERLDALQPAEARRQVLREEYFVQRPLDTSLF